MDLNKNNKNSHFDFGNKKANSFSQDFRSKNSSSSIQKKPIPHFVSPSKPNNSNFSKSENSSNFYNSVDRSNLSQFVLEKEKTEKFSSAENFSKSLSENKNSELKKEDFSKNSNEKENYFKENKKMISFLEKIIVASIYFLIAGLPLFFLNSAYQGINFEKQFYFYFWTFIGVMSWGMKSVLSGSFTFRKTQLDGALLIFVFIYILSTIFSIDKYHSLVGLFSHPITGLISILALILVYYFLVMNVSYAQIKNLIYVLSGVGVFVSIWTSFGFILALLGKLPNQIFSKIPFNFVGFSFYSLATYLVFLIPILIISIHFIDESKQKVKTKKILNYLFYLVLISIFFNISILFNYVYWVPFLISLGILVIFILGKIVNFSPKIFYTILAIFFISVIFFLIKIPIFKNDFLQKEMTMNYKTAFEVAKNSLKENFILGSGPSTFGYDFSLFRPKSETLEGWENSRFYLGKNLIFENLSTIGILGSISFLTIILLYIGSFFHMLNRHNKENKIVSLCLFVANLIIVFSAMTGFLDGGLIILGVFITALSLIAIQEEAEVKSNEKTFSLKTSPQYALLHSFLFIIIIVGIIFGLVNLGKIFLADVDIKKAFNYQSKGDGEKATNYFSKALSKNENEGNYYSNLSLNCFSVLNSSDANKIKLPICETSLSQLNLNQPDLLMNSTSNDVVFALLSAKLMPDDVRINQNAGLVVYKSGWKYVADSLNEARKLYRKALELEPKNPFFEIALGDINLTESQIGEVTEENLNSKRQLVEEAKKLFESSQNKFVSPNQYIPIYEKFSVVNERLGNLDEAIKNLETATNENGKVLLLQKNEFVLNQQINYEFNLARLLTIRGTMQNNQNSKADLEKAEILLKQILQVNSREINSLLSLGLLYEKTGRIDEAIAQYNKIIETLPKENEVRAQVEQVINNLKKKKESGQI